MGTRLRGFRRRYGLTQAEVAGVIGLGAKSAVCRWEAGAAVPDGVPRERLKELLAGRLWPELRAVAMASAGLPESRERGARWYRRASRERRLRETAGAVVAVILEDLPAAESSAGLRRTYAARDGDWARAVAAELGNGEGDGSSARRIEDAAYGLRWLEIAQAVRFDLGRSLAPQAAGGLRGC